MKLSEYELKCLREIHEWKRPKTGWTSKFFAAVDWPFEKASGALLDTPLLGDLLQKSMAGVTHQMNNFAQWSVNTEGIFKEFRKSGHSDVKGIEDIQDLELDEVHKTVGWLNVKYETLAGAEGTSVGFAGLPGIPLDVVALLSLNLRAIGEYATYYGFDIDKPEERLFAINILALASSPTEASKVLAMAQLVKIAQEAAHKQVWTELQKRGLITVVEAIARTLGIRLTRAKIAQMIPVAGAVVGGGFNMYFTKKITRAAHLLYSERFLAAKYGADVIAESVKPAESLNPHYPEENENLGHA